VGDLFGDPHEGMWMSSRFAGIDSDLDGSRCSVFETNRHREAGSKLTMKLGLGGSSTDGTPGDEIGLELTNYRKGVRVWYGEGRGDQRNKIGG